jgi:hypothetical protein
MREIVLYDEISFNCDSSKGNSSAKTFLTALCGEVYQQDLK